jgi:hypothetical protein
MHPSDDPQAPPESAGKGQTPLREKWTLAAVLVIASLYMWLFQIRPSGEGWGRGWNLVAFLFYASPPAVVAGAVALWRAGKTAGSLQRWAFIAAALGLAFPIIAIVVIQLRA